MSTERAARMSAVSREGLVVELLFNGNAEDTSGGGHHGAVHGAAPTADRFGNPNGAYLFDGTDDYVVLAPPPRVSGRYLSVSVWVRIDTLDLEGWSHCFICQDNGDDEDQSRRVFQLSVYEGRVVWHRMTGARDPTARRVVRVGTWCHLAAVVEDGVHRLYIDGDVHDSVRHPLRVHAEQPIHLGRKGTPEPCFFLRGAIDDVRVYDRALDAGDIRTLYGEGGYQKQGDPGAADRISGIWGIDERGLLDLRFDGHSVSGSVIAGRPGNLAAIQRGTFDPKTGVLRLEGEARRPDNAAVVAYAIEGQLAKGRLTVSYRFGDDRGTGTLRRVTPWRTLRSRTSKVAARWASRCLEPLIVPIVRILRGLQRPSKATNIRRLRERGETTAALIFRDATPEDIPTLAALHVTTWNATYPGTRRPPTYEIREWQWREAFAKADGSWFCVVIENATGELVGFAKGIRHANGSGDLNKIYLLSEYQRLGLGRQLVGHVVRRFLRDGVSSMTLSADEANPSCRFYLALGAENPRDASGRVHRGSFIWRDLPALASVCPVEATDRQDR